MHVIDTLDVGGAENMVANIVNHMSDRFRSAVCCLQHSGPVAEKIRDKSVEVIELGKGDGNDYGIPFRLGRLFKEKDIHVVQSHDWGVFCEAVSGALLAGAPVKAHMVHGKNRAAEDASVLGRTKRWVRHGAERALAAGVDRIIAVSDRVKEEIVREVGVPAGKVTVIRNGISLETEAPREACERNRREIGLASGEVLVCSVGRLAAIKNYLSLIESFGAIERGAVGKVKLALVGEGPERPRLEEAVARLNLKGRVHLLGERKDVRAWLAIADIFVLPSLYEGVSVALLEAMSMGLACVATRVGGNAEVLSAGETGLLVEKEDRAGLAAAILSLVRDEGARKRLGGSARREVAAKYDLKEIVKQYEAIYLEKLLRNR